MTLLTGIKQKAGSRKQKAVFGFTLLELLLVIGIIAVLAGVTFPLIKKTIQSARFKTFADKAYLFLDYSKTQAILRNAVLKVKLDSGSKTLVLAEVKDDLSETALYKINIPENMNLESELEEISFFPDSTLQPFTITISGAGGAVRSITSKGIDGKIVVE